MQSPPETKQGEHSLSLLTNYSVPVQLPNGVDHDVVHDLRRDRHRVRYDLRGSRLRAGRLHVHAARHHD